MSDTFSVNDDGIVYASQSLLIGLQSDARLLRQHKIRARSRMSGNYLTTFKGRGMEFDEARPYQPGDDIRNMDWRVTARTNKPHSKVFREERERPVLLWTDFRKPMFFGTQNCYKSVLAARVSALLAWQACQQGDRLGGLIFSEANHLELRPKRGKTAALHMIRQLSEFSYPAQNRLTQEQLKSHDGRHALSRLVQVTRPGSLIYMVSDFRNTSDQLESVLNRLSRHNELVLIHVSDPLESQLPVAGYYRVSDGINEAEINASGKKLRFNYHHRFHQHRENLKSLCLRNGVRFISLSTDQPLLNGLLNKEILSKDSDTETLGAVG